DRVVLCRRFAWGRHAAPRWFSREGHVDGVEYRLRRAEREGERHVRERPLRLAMTLGEGALHLREHLGRRALEGEDGLLLVADREHGPVHLTRAGSCEKLGAERRENAPLGRGCVLGFVEQQVVEPIV